ncbi:GAF domain-containing protein [Desulfosalsimonas sp.]|uniref:GAF domain-containing protein n=1 Tax=Desulfosalsimonas sp. TaxID=3073848 RepID=UPI0039705C77
MFPLVYKGQRLGLLQFNDYKKGRFKKKDLEIFQALADNLAMRLIQILNLDHCLED